MKLQQLMQLTPQGVARAAMKLQLIGFTQTSETPLTYYKAGLSGVSRKVRKTTIVVNDSTGDVQVQCSCHYFESVLTPSLAGQGLVLDGTVIDRKNRLVGKFANKISLCSHLYHVGLIINSPSSLKRTLKETRTETTAKISSKLKGL
jgi:hypothetical protein